MTNFPYPLKTKNLTVYGRKYCPYCIEMKKIQKSIKNSVYYDIDELIENKIVKNFKEFQKNMKPFIEDYPMIPIVFVNDTFIGGYDDFIKLFKKETKKKRKTKNEKNNVIKEQNILKKLLNKLQKA